MNQGQEVLEGQDQEVLGGPEVLVDLEAMGVLEALEGLEGLEYL